jgi:hypothetical protein
MQTGREANQWNHTASIIANIRAALGDKRASPKDYHPHYNVRQMSHKAAFKMIASKHQKEPEQ